MESTFYKTTFIDRCRAGRGTRRAGPFPNESKRIESEVIPRKSLKKGVLTLVTWAGALTPAGCRQRAKLGLAFTRRAGRVLFLGSLFLRLHGFLDRVVTSVRI